MARRNVCATPKSTLSPHHSAGAIFSICSRATLLARSFPSVAAPLCWRDLFHLSPRHSAGAIFSICRRVTPDYLHQ
jgi:hypothetical protein